MDAPSRRPVRRAIASASMTVIAAGLRVGAVVVATMLLAACAPTSPPPPSSTGSPSPESTRFADSGLALVGPTETVWDWTTQACESVDIPDLPARAFRDAANRVNLIAAHDINRRFVGASLDDVSHECQVIMESPTDWDPAHYADHTWLAAPYTEDGQTVYALVHNEYQAFRHPGQCASGEYFPCWYNAVTLAVSTNGGASYQPAAPPPAHLVATLPQRYEDGAGPYGVFEPTNIIKGRDGAYYAFVRIDEYRSDDQRICLLRTTDLATPSAWQAWRGIEFDVALHSPYTDPDISTTKRCAAIDVDHLGVMASSVTYNTYLDRYVMVGTTAVHDETRGTVWGVLYSMSDDLINWTPRRLLVECELPWTYQPGDGNVYLYPALLDPASPSRNFETTGKTAYLYLTRFNMDGASDLDRDLVRIPVEFFPTNEEAVARSVPFQP